MKRVLSIILVLIFLLNSSLMAIATETEVPPVSEMAPVTEESSEEEQSENSITPRITPSTSYIPAREPINDGNMTMDEGVYYIKHNEEKLYMGVTSGGTANNTSLELQAQSTSGSSYLCQLWKVVYWGNGYYSLHPLHKMDSAIALVGGVILTGSGTPEESSEMAEAFLWEIGYGEDGFTIQNYSSITTGVGASGNAVNHDSADAWTFEEVTNVPEGVALYAPAANYIAPGETRSSISFGIEYSYYFGGNQAYHRYWTSGNTSIASVNYTTGVVTGVSPGTATIYLTIDNENGGSFTQNYSVTVLDLPIGTYTMINKGSKRYATVKEHTFSAATPIIQSEFDNTSYQRWTFSHLGDGYYAIKSAASSSVNYYLAIQANYTSNGAHAVAKAGPITAADSGMRWKITRQDGGTYVIMPKSGENNELVLAPPAETNNSSVQLEQRSYNTANQDYYEWRIHYQVEVLYDQAYATRYTNYLTRINACLEEVSEYYWNTFGFTLSFSTPAQYTSYADQCPTNSLSGICTCSNDCESSPDRDTQNLETYHHTNSNNVLYRTQVPASKNYATLAFVGNLICHKQGGLHLSDEDIDTAVYGQADNANNVCIVMNHHLLASNQTEAEISSVIHELGHLWGALDHYDSSAASGFEDECIYGCGQSKDDNGNLLMCDGCKTLIRGSMD